MVVMGRLAGNERVLAGGQIEPLDEAEVGEDIERSEDGCAAHAEAISMSLKEQLLGREVAIVPADEASKRAAGLGEAIAGGIEGGDDGSGADHRATISVSRLSRNKPQVLR